MSRWSDAYEKHPIHENLQTLNKLASVEHEDRDVDHEAELRRFRKVLSTAEDAIRGQDSDTFPAKLFDSLRNGLIQNQVSAHLSNYQSSGNVQQLRQANDAISSQISTIHQIGAIKRPVEITSEANEIRALHEQYAKETQEAIDDFYDRLEAAESQLTSLVGNIKTYGESLNTLREESSAVISSLQSTFNEAENDRQSAFSQDQDTRRSEHSKQLSELRSDAEEEAKSISATHRQTLEENHQDHLERVNTLYEEALEKHQSILELHGLVGADAVAGGYKAGADDEKSAAEFWRYVAMGALSCAAIWLIIKFFMGVGETASGGINWAELITAASLTLVLLTAAGYASQQAKAHRDAQQQMHWFFLEVKAIDPFIASLDEAQQRELKRQLSERLFGKDRSSVGSGNIGLSPKDLEGLVKAIATPVTEAVKAATKSS
ncbi:hypothetical protein ACQ5SO_01915 [Rhodovulum sp. DZ06]|uniref:hypothetical protein n=1 Tax=Rhodovulum sp. DZ06 TaxID=3425126 RepID=UPI003D346028